MDARPALEAHLDARAFLQFYYLKEELTAFCREQGLPASGSKTELTCRIARYLDTGERTAAAPKRRNTAAAGPLMPDTRIEPGFVCSERHRAFFKAQLGPGFSFNVPFQKWLKANAGKTYAQAVAAYGELAAEKKRRPAAIDPQFEYNTYIRDFFADNPGAALRDAIRCWNYKKSLPGSRRYAPSDRAALAAADG